MAGALPGLGQSAGAVGVVQNGIAVSPANASAQYRLLTTGEAQSAPTSGVFSDVGRWLTGCGPPDGYWVRMTPTSGTFSSGSTAIQQLNATRTWARNRTSDVAGTTSVTATCEIATDAAMAQIIASFTVTLNATVVV